MESIKSFILLTIFSLILVETLALSETFNLTSHELIKKCNQKGPASLNNVTSTLQSLKTIQEIIIKKYIKYTKWNPPFGNWISIIIMSRLCENNSEVIEAEKNLIEAVQSCLDENERLNDKVKQNVMRNMMLSVCFSLDFEKFVQSKRNCVADPRKMLADDKCREKYPNFNNIHYLEPIPLLHTPQECEAFSKVWSCEINAAEYCKDSTKDYLQEFIAGMLDLFYC